MEYYEYGIVYFFTIFVDSLFDPFKVELEVVKRLAW